MKKKTRPFPETKINVRQFLESSYLLPRHECCWDTVETLFPPSTQVEVPIGKKDGTTYVAICKPLDRWNIDLDNSANASGIGVVFVEFCPFCGEELPGIAGEEKAK